MTENPHRTDARRLRVCVFTRSLEERIPSFGGEGCACSDPDDIDFIGRVLTAQRILQGCKENMHEPRCITFTIIPGTLSPSQEQRKKNQGD